MISGIAAARGKELQTCTAQSQVEGPLRNLKELHTCVTVTTGYIVLTLSSPFLSTI